MPFDIDSVDCWVFDLDNTLYPASCHLFAQIDQRMAAFISARLGLADAEARRLQKDFYVRYGTTLAGLMAEHAVPPHDFLDFVHDIDVSGLTPDARLQRAIAQLPGRRYIFTNGSTSHARNVAGQLGIFDLFDDVFDISASGFQPKPRPEPYHLFLDRHGVDPARAAFFEDMPENLLVPYTHGMRTVLVQSDAPWFDDEPAAKRPARIGEHFAHVHHVTADLTGFLVQLTSPQGQP